VILDRAGILALLPHRDPFLMVDEMLSIEPTRSGVGVKHVRADEEWARGHFPGNPILPGVLVTEALAQVAAIVFLAAHPERAARVRVYLVGVDRMRFRRIIRPGDDVHLKVELTGHKRNVWTFDGEATVGGEVAADGRFLAAIEEE
jgi:3-hydroxyacyl-[acyl-carrier-protein] dehydratase